jgi:CRISPR-associated endonuclease/helicase Cas3
MAAAFAAAWHCAWAGKAAGLLHDLGKASEQFQRYLAGIGASGGDHKGLGVRLSASLGFPLSFAVAGHHGALPDRGAVKALMDQPPEEGVAALAEDLLSALGLDRTPHYPDYVASSPEEAELFTRMLFSALVDADFLDTEEHFDPDRSRGRPEPPALSELWDRYQAHYDRQFGALPPTSLNLTRRDIYERCLQEAQQPPGAFSLTVPTGGGKTLASMAFALAHALTHPDEAFRRIIVVIPYTSILEQTADVYRGIFGEEAVLEHHSALQWREDEDERRERWELLAENWDARIIVTTSVQFFESLFASTPAKCRKLHNIARSVVIIDEVQTLPVDLLKPSFAVLASLVRHFGVTCLLTTATQPAYSRFTDLPIREIVPDPPALARQLKRVRYEPGTPRLTWEEVAALMAQSGQAMAVVNTRKDAQALFASLPLDGRIHLSTNMCAAHRRQVLAQVRQRLDHGEPCLLATTQLVEAGVDLDFPLVLRAMGPLERIVQAAGRCNREGKFPEGRVIVFEPTDGGMPPGIYRSGFDVATALFEEYPDLDLGDPAVHELYFSRLYGVTELDARHIAELRRRFDFPAVAEAYKIIPDDTVAVAIPWGEGEAMLDALEQSGRATRDDLRRLQPYFVNLLTTAHERARSAGLVREVLPGSGLWRWEGGYDHVHLGLQWPSPTCI